MTHFDPIHKIIRQIPKACLSPSNQTSTLYLLRDFLFIGLVASAIILADSWLLGLPLSILLGFCVCGLFIIGHDCGHKSFSKNIRYNNFVGHLTTSWVLWPFHVWRIDHDNHHKNTNHIDKDPAWRPVTYKMYKRMPKHLQRVYRWTRCRFFMLGSIYTTYLNFKEGFKAQNSNKFTDEQKKQIRFSIYITIVLSGISIAAASYFAGIYGFVYLILIPNFTFQCLLSTFTFFHHTNADTKFLDRKSWNIEQAQLAGSFHVSYPKWVEFLTHDINWHVPHHVCVGIPHYRLRPAHDALKAAYPEHVKEYRFTWSYIQETISSCHFVKSKFAPADLSWVSFDEAKEIEGSRKLKLANAKA